MTDPGSTKSDLSPIADVGAQRIGRIYAEALLNAAEKRGQADEVLAELEALQRDVLQRHEQVAAFVASGTVGRHRKAETLQRVFEQRASEVLVNFLMVLNAHERLDLLKPIVAAYRALRDERARRIRVQVRSAVLLADDQRERLQHELRAAFQLEPMLETQVDPELIGGMVVRVGDWLYDASVRTRLGTIRNQLVARSSHEIQSGRDRFSSASGD